VFPAASVIKIAVALEVLCAIEEGALDASSQLELRASDKVIGSGVLAALEPGLRLSILDLLYLSTAISDNTAANLLIGRVGTTAVNARLAKLGLTTTRLTGRIFVEGENGERSPSTAAELVTLLRRVHDRDGLPPRACEKLVALLERTQTASTIGRGLPDERFPGISKTTPPELVLAYKTGSIEGVVAEAAIVRAPRATYAIAVMSEGSGDLRPNHDNVARVHLGAVSRAVYETFIR
jgi:beta-lactamase class A